MAPATSGTVSPPSQRLIITALLLTQVLFGINYAVAKIVVSAINPLVWAAIRALITAALLFVVAYKRPHPKGGRIFFRRVLLFAIIGVAFNQACFLIGLHYTTSTNGAILNTLIPVFAIVFITLLGKEKLTPVKLGGFVCAFLGALIILRVERLQLSDATVLGDLLMVLNSMSYGLYLALSKEFLERHDRLWVTFWQFLLGSMLLNLVALPSWLTSTPPVFTPGLLAAMTFVVLGGSFFPYIFNNWALAHTEASRVALYIYVQPAVAAAVATLWFGEVLTMRTLVGTAFIFAGAYLTSVPRREAPKSVIKPLP